MLRVYRKMEDVANAKRTNGAFSRKKGRILRHENTVTHGEVIAVSVNPQQMEPIGFSWNNKRTLRAIPGGAMVPDKYLKEVR